MDQQDKITDFEKSNQGAVATALALVEPADAPSDVVLMVIDHRGTNTPYKAEDVGSGLWVVSGSTKRVRVTADQTDFDVGAVLAQFREVARPSEEKRAYLQPDAAFTPTLIVSDAGFAMTFARGRELRVYVVSGVDRGNPIPADQRVYRYEYGTVSGLFRDSDQIMLRRLVSDMWSLANGALATVPTTSDEDDDTL